MTLKDAGKMALVGKTHCVGDFGKRIFIFEQKFGGVCDS